MNKLERLEGESAEIYELRCKNHSDIKMMRAKICFDRKSYYQTYKEKQNGQNSINKGTEMLGNSTS